ncbi:hypothetical protein ACFQ1L_46850 [Phytohabitans flavus]
MQSTSPTHRPTPAAAAVVRSSGTGYALGSAVAPASSYPPRSCSSACL